MRVLHFTKYYAKGGASRAALDSAQGQRDAGIDSRVCVGRRAADAPDWVIQPSPLADRLALARFAAERVPGMLMRLERHDTRSIGWSGIDGAALARRINASLCVLHNIDGLLSVESLRAFPMPLVWRAHDMWAMCGTEHYTMDPAPYHVPPDGAGPDWFSRWTFARKQAAFARIGSLDIAAPSRWLASEFERSALFAGRRVHVIANGIDTDVFAPVDRRAARAEFGFDPDRKIVLFGSAGGTADPRKGFDLLVTALRQLGSEQAGGASLVAFGGGAVPDIGMPTINLGPIAERARLARLYSAANVMIVPSRMENLSLTVLESLACGTPVIAFDIGGMPDMVIPEKTGWLVAPFETADMARRIGYALAQSEAEASAMRAACRELAVEQFSRKVEAAQMVALFNRILSDQPGVQGRF